MVWLVMIAALAEQAPVMYRWTDPDGVVHFSDQPPLDQTAEVVEPDATRLISVPPPATKSDVYRPTRAPRRQRRAPPDKAPERCQTALQRIDTMNARMRAGYSAQQGERMREQLREYKKDRLKWCMGRGE